MRLTGLHIYPIKSSAGLALPEAQVEARGLRHDRRWMLVDAEGRFVTGRQYPRLVLLRAFPSDDGLRIEAPGREALRVLWPAPDAARVGVTVWKDTIEAALAAPAAHEWLSAFLGSEVRLVHLDAASVRNKVLSPPLAPAAHPVSFADGYPLLLISEPSLAELNSHLLEPVTMAHFRPNLVVSAGAPHAEDGWRRIRIGSAEFDLVKTCVRCVFTTVLPDEGRRRDDGEPLRTLKTYRRSQDGVIFGMNLVVRQPGRLALGDAVTVLD
jgi:hypothetical protein